MAPTTMNTVPSGRFECLIKGASAVGGTDGAGYVGTAVSVVDRVGRPSLDVDDVTAGIVPSVSVVAVPVAVITPVVRPVVAAVVAAASEDSAVDVPAAAVVFLVVVAAVAVVLPAGELDVAAMAVDENMATAAIPEMKSARFSETRDRLNFMVVVYFVFVSVQVLSVVSLLSLDVNAMPVFRRDRLQVAGELLMWWNKEWPFDNVV